jgi:hypothetical protein
MNGSLYWWIGAVSKQRTDDRRQKSSQLVGTAYRTRDLAASLFIRRGYFLIFTVRAMIHGKVRKS